MSTKRTNKSNKLASEIGKRILKQLLKIDSLNFTALARTMKCTPQGLRYKLTRVDLSDKVFLSEIKAAAEKAISELRALTDSISIAASKL